MTPEVDVVYGKGSRYSVVVKESVTSIGHDAFFACTGLTSVTFPEGLTSIGGSAFWRCTGLVSVTVPDSAQLGLGFRAFSDGTRVQNRAGLNQRSGKCPF